MVFLKEFSLMHFGYGVKIHFLHRCILWDLCCQLWLWMGGFLSGYSALARAWYLEKRIMTSHVSYSSASQKNKLLSLEYFTGVGNSTLDGFRSQTFFSCALYFFENNYSKHFSTSSNKKCEMHFFYLREYCFSGTIKAQIFMVHVRK